MNPKALLFVLIAIFTGCSNTEKLLLHSKNSGSQPVSILYKNYCASCHGSGRLGAMGPALLPENLSRLKKTEAVAVIKNGRVATQMPPFGALLNEKEIKSLIEFIYSPLKSVPEWSKKNIEKSRQDFGCKPDDKSLLPAGIDPLNLFVIVELGDHHITVLDGDKLVPLKRLKTDFAVHGGVKFSPGGRYAYIASRDGWISRYDLYTLKLCNRVRAGINIRNIAVSADGKYLAAANYLPHTLAILDAENFSVLRVLAVKSGGRSSRVSAVYSAPPRKSFILALKDIKEVWEFPYSAVKRDRGLRKIKTESFIDDFFFNQSYSELIGASRAEQSALVLDLDSGRELARIKLSGMPHLGAGISFDYHGRRVMALPNLGKGLISVIDMSSWKTVKEIKTAGPGFFIRSHEKSPYFWADVFFGPNRDKIHVIDKKTLKIVKTLIPAPGKTSAHIEFDRYGRYALVSIWDMDGALVIYDAGTLKEVKRIKMKKPSGKYN
ncbi:MAG: cytochrome C oxidase Cbb3, partial [Candidatus Dadabacteria bacterium]